MKTKALLIPMIGIVAGAITFSACNKKVDEKTMAEVTQFGTDWTAMGEKAVAWSNDLSQTAARAKEFAGKQTEMMNGMMNSKDEMMKTKMQEMVKTANENSMHLDAMVTDWNTWKTSWDENTKNFVEWQNKVVKGEVGGDQVIAGLNDWKTKMTDAQQKVEGWNTAYMSVKESCDKTMAMSDEMSKTMTTTSTPATGKMKK